MHVNISPFAVCNISTNEAVCTCLEECHCHLLPLIICQDAQMPECAVLQGYLVQEACESTLLLLSPADTPLVRPTCQLLLHLAKQCRVVLKDAVCAAHRKC